MDAIFFDIQYAIIIDVLLPKLYFFKASKKITAVLSEKIITDINTVFDRDYDSVRDLVNEIKLSNILDHDEKCILLYETTNYLGDNTFDLFVNEPVNCKYFVVPSVLTVCLWSPITLLI